jgi:hypothetical protein
MALFQFDGAGAAEITIDASRLTVLVTGNFVTGDAAAFQAKIAPLAGNFVVQFRSDGGLVFEALP